MKDRMLLWIFSVLFLCMFAAWFLIRMDSGDLHQNPDLENTQSGSPESTSENDGDIHTDPETVSPFQGNTSQWNLLLVNPWNQIPDDFSVKLTELVNGHAIDERAYPDLQAMMDAMRKEGLSPLICSSYRTHERQRELYRNQIDAYLAQGYSQTAAEAEAGKWVAIPGTSEHETGLAVDIVDMSYQLLDRQQENTAVQQWLKVHAYEYGFILRYPTDKSEITGIYYEPWHYRYVGYEAAKEIYEKGICLEEYLAARALS